jgi:KTSC domain
MDRKPLRSGKLRAAGYDESSRTMEIEFVNGDVFEYKPVSRELFRQLMASPSPSSFFEDKIDEQFNGKRLAKSSKSDAGDAFDSLFGKE